MSNSLVHKSLELVWNEESYRTRKSARNNACAPHGSPVSAVIRHKRDLYKEQKKKKKSTEREGIRYKGVLDLIPAKHRITVTRDNTDVCAVLGGSSKTTIYETRKRIAAQQDLTNDNLQKLLLLGSNTIKCETASNLLQRAVRRRCSRKVEKPKESEETAFTEEDFKKFEREYNTE